MPDPRGILSPLVKDNENIWPDTPYKIVFAYDGIDKDTICGHIDDFYTTHNNIPAVRKPNIIHVLNKYVVMRIVPGMKVLKADGKVEPIQPDAGQFHWFTREPDVLAMTWALNHLQNRHFLINNSMIRYGEWINGLVNRIVTSDDASRN